MKIKTQNTFNDFKKHEEWKKTEEVVKLIINDVCFCFVKNGDVLKIEVQSYE